MFWPIVIGIIILLFIPDILGIVKGLVRVAFIVAAILIILYVAAYVMGIGAFEGIHDAEKAQESVLYYDKGDNYVNENQESLC